LYARNQQARPTEDGLTSTGFMSLNNNALIGKGLATYNIASPFFYCMITLSIVNLVEINAQQGNNYRQYA